METTSKSGSSAQFTGADSQPVRKQVTVLFCDIADYTSRAAATDPEVLAEEIHQFQSICRAIAETCNGHISNYLGDGIMVLFGHPNASEFSPERAVRAGLEMVNAIKQLNQSVEWTNKRPLAIRIGIATGLVVVGDRAGEQRDQDELIFGSAPNLAARLQDIAKPNTVVTALRTRRLVGLAFRFRDLGKFNLKGFDHPISAWQILTERKLQKRPGNILIRNNADFISRETELRLLKQNYDSACYGFSRFLHIQGEPGIGKTRLIRKFEKSLIPNEVHRIRINCSPYHQSSFLRPINDECFRWLHITDEDDMKTKQAGVSWAMSIVKLNKVDQYLLFTELLNIDPPSGLPVVNLNSNEIRRRIISSLVDVLYAVSKDRPVLLIAEDLHWADPSTLEFISLVLSRSTEEKVMGVFTSREHFKAPWGRHDSLVDVDLEGLTQVESGRLVDSVFREHDMPLSLKQSLVKKSDGIPLFLEESCLNALAHMNTAGKNNQMPVEYDVPETLQDSLNARLDQLGPAKLIAQLASTFGESFSVQAITRIGRQNQIDVEAGLAVLVEQNVIVPYEDASADRYRFHHAMFQEAAYLSLLIKTRQLYHQQIAELFLANDPDFYKKYPEILAHHLSKTEQIIRAIELWNEAGKSAIAKSAFLEAIEHLQKGLSLISTVEESAVRQQLELDLQLNLGVALTARAGYYGFEVTRTYDRAVELSRVAGDERQQWNALYGSWRCLVAQAEFGTAMKLSTRLNLLGKKLDDPLITLTCVGIKAMTRLVDGKLQKADELTRQSAAFYKADYDRKIGLEFGQDPFVTIQGLGAVAQLLRCRIPESLTSINNALTVARKADHPYTVANTLKLASMYQYISRNIEALRSHCDEALELSEHYGFEGVVATHRVFLSFAEIVVHKEAAEIPTIRENIVIYERKYGLLFIPFFKTILAEAYMQLEQFADAFETANVVLEDVEISGEKWVLPVAYCIKAEAAVRGSIADTAAAKEWYLLSLEIAARQGAILILGRALQSRHYFELDSELVDHYLAIAGSSDNGHLNANHDFITRKH